MEEMSHRVAPPRQDLGASSVPTGAPEIRSRLAAPTQIAEMFDSMQNLCTQLDTILRRSDENLLISKAIYRRTKKMHPGASITQELHLSDAPARSSDQKSFDRSNCIDNTQASSEEKNTPAVLMESQLGPAPAFLSLVVDASKSQKVSIDNSGTVTAITTGSRVPTAVTTGSQVPNSVVTCSSKGLSPMCEDIRYVGSHARLTRLSDATRMIMADRNSMSQKVIRLWRFLEDKNSSKGARDYFYARDVVVFFSIIFACMDLAKPYDEDQDIVRIWEESMHLAIEMLFAVELAVRFLCSPNWAHFFRNFYNVMDLVFALPIPLRFCILADPSIKDSVEITSFLSVVPVLRMLKAMRYFETFQLLLYAFEVAVEILPVLIFTLFIMSITFASMIYDAEPREIFPTTAYCLYFVMVTLSTVGYGDITPTTDGGKICTVLVIVVGAIYMAIPLGIVGKTFGDIWEDRHRLILLQRMRNCIYSAGFTRNDFEVLYKIIDKNGDGILDLEGFSELLCMLEVNVERKLVQTVFVSLDETENGSVDFVELLTNLFPRARWN